MQQKRQAKAITKQNQGGGGWVLCMLHMYVGVRFFFFKAPIKCRINHLPPAIIDGVHTRHEVNCVLASQCIQVYYCLLAFRKRFWLLAAGIVPSSCWFCLVQLLDINFIYSPTGPTTVHGAHAPADELSTIYYGMKHEVHWPSNASKYHCL
jgi:hypothetical protein